MSRCFPYPPPGYTLSRASKDALIESIKLQKEREKTKEQRKEKRKVKKEKRKKKKEKNVETNQISDYYEIPKGSTGKSILANSEQLEKSSLTEENEQPICLRLPSSSSESTENSNKRKRQSSPTDGNQGYCHIIRLRLPSKVQNKSDASINEQQLCSTSESTLPSKIQNGSDALIPEQQLCSTSGRMLPSKIQNDSDTSSDEQQPFSTPGRTDIPAQIKDDCLRNKQENSCCLSKETSNIGQGFTPKTNKKSICSTSVKFDTVSPGKTGSPSVPGAVTTSIQRQELLYKNLIENCFPPLHQDTSFHLDDLSWLFPGKKQGSLQQDRLFDSDDLSFIFPGKNQGSPIKKRQKSDGMSCSSPSSLWQPRAQYLPQVDEYALPYTVPF